MFALVPKYLGDAFISWPWSYSPMKSTFYNPPRKVLRSHWARLCANDWCFLAQDPVGLPPSPAGHQGCHEYCVAADWRPLLSTYQFKELQLWWQRYSWYFLWVVFPTIWEAKPLGCYPSLRAFLTKRFSIFSLIESLGFRTELVYLALGRFLKLHLSTHFRCPYFHV